MKNKDHSFFLYLAHTMPHVQIDASPKFKGQSDGGLYGDVIEEIDWSAGRILEVIKDLDLSEKTILLFTSDNGPWLSKGDMGGSSSPLREGKGSAWEGGFRVPAIIWGPGRIPEDTQSSEILATLDIMPTFAALADAKMPDDRVIDGLDQSELFLGNSKKSKRDIFYYYVRGNLHAVRKGDWKLALPDRKKFFNYAKDKTEVVTPELYNLKTDLSETINIASEHSDKVNELLNLAIGARRDIGDLDRIGNNSRKKNPISDSRENRDLKKKAIKQVDIIKNLIDDLSDSLWIYSEIALKEYKSSQLLISKLREEGFSIETGVADLPTAFVASYGSGSPIIGILAEYDALPGVGNEPVPERQSRKDGITSGHGCGHNLFGAASVGGALAIKKIMVENNLRGTIKLFGTPAEETVVGKVYMAKAGVFNGLDAVIDWHPGTENKVKNQPGRAMNSFEVEFFGQAAHASADPWNGRSALDAVELMNYAVNMMREHVKPTARIHYVIPNAGDAPNVVPEYAKVWYYVRDINREEVQKSYDRMLKIAEAAAMATETTHKVKLITGVHKYLLNRPLQEAMQRNMELVGAPYFDDDEQAFARQLQRNAGKKEIGFNEKIGKLADSLGAVEGGSTDVAEVSWIVPTAGFSVTTTAEDVPWHSWATTACHGTSAGRKGAVVAAKIIAATGTELLINKKLIREVKEFFTKSTAGKPYKSPLD
jgi:aminobenzoyl-glutamate utilization protein B